MIAPRLRRPSSSERVFRILKLHGHFAFDLNGADAGVFPRQQDQDHVAIALGRTGAPLADSFRQRS